MTETISDLMEYLAERGAPYDIPADDLLAAIPESAREPKLAYEFMQLKDISHIEPLSKGGATAGDNWVLEDSSVNRARGAETMTQTEQNTAELDGIRDAQSLRHDAMVDRTVATAVGGITATAAIATVGLPLAALAAGVVAGIRFIEDDCKRIDNICDKISQWKLTGESWLVVKHLNGVLTKDTFPEGKTDMEELHWFVTKIVNRTPMNNFVRTHALRIVHKDGRIEIIKLSAFK